MAVDERARHELYGQLERTLGPEATGTLMELLPPVGWADVATKQDLDALGHRVDAQISGVRAEMADLRTDLRTGMAELQTEMADFCTDLRTEMADLRTDVGTEVATLGGELRREMADGQRLLIFAVLGAMFTLTGLVWAVLTLAQ
ncbi:hypothetical protein [Salsipaludibacter albus]|uniref:hypothetical protein n=1 Tax=Salsipaludibacter albus TaxID=2849650 RepID=UPI001EE4EA74|nr:hypothetical protein [Salsipaludibacter albus]MBY5162056.1 hypothetical protein [Salsipaludibacter albus]